MVLKFTKNSVITCQLSSIKLVEKIPEFEIKNIKGQKDKRTRGFRNYIILVNGYFRSRKNSYWHDHEFEHCAHAERDC